MKTKTEKSSQIPAQKQIDSILADIESLGKRMESFTLSLSAAERHASLKMRLGGEQVIATVGQLADQHNVSLPGISSSTMNADLLLCQRIRPLAEGIQRLERRLDDTLIAATARCWNAATALYTALARSASTTPTVEAGLRPVVAFFATRARKKPPANDAGPVTPPTGVPSTPTSSAG